MKLLNYHLLFICYAYLFVRFVRFNSLLEQVCGRSVVVDLALNREEYLSTTGMNKAMGKPIPIKVKGSISMRDNNTR